MGELMYREWKYLQHKYRAQVCDQNYVKQILLEQFVVPEHITSMVFRMCHIPDFSKIKLPDKLEILHLESCTGEITIPEGITTLELFHTRVNNIPSTVKILYCGYDVYQQNREKITPLVKVNIDINLRSRDKHIVADGTKFPPNVKRITFGCYRGEVIFCRKDTILDWMFSNPASVIQNRNNFAAKMIQRTYLRWKRKRTQAANFLQRWWHQISFNRGGASFRVLGEALQ